MTTRDITLIQEEEMTERADRQHRIAERKTARIYESFIRGGGVDLFLWRGSKEPKLVERIGAWIIGLFFALSGVALWAVIRKDDPAALKLIPIACILLGAKVFRNGFRQRA